MRIETFAVFGYSWHLSTRKKRTMMYYAGTREIHRSYKIEQNSTDFTKKKTK